MTFWWWQCISCHWDVRSNHSAMSEVFASLPGPVYIDPGSRMEQTWYVNQWNMEQDFIILLASSSRTTFHTFTSFHPHHIESYLWHKMFHWNYVLITENWIRSLPENVTGKTSRCQEEKRHTKKRVVYKHNHMDGASFFTGTRLAQNLERCWPLFLQSWINMDQSMTEVMAKWLRWRVSGAWNVLLMI